MLLEEKNRYFRKKSRWLFLEITPNGSFAPQQMHSQIILFSLSLLLMVNLLLLVPEIIAIFFHHQKLPQLAALHYNNCMYLAHHCITLGHQFQSSLPGQLNSSATTFVDLVPVLRKSGTDCFLQQIVSFTC